MPLRAAYAQQPPPRVGLADAVRRALAANTTVLAAVENVTRAEALVSQARAGLFPTLNANAAYTRIDDERVFSSGGVRRVVRGQNQVEANLQLTVPLLSPQALERSHRARDGRDVAAAATEDVRRQVALATARAYLAIVAQRRVINSSERARNTARAHHDYAETRLKGGIGRGIDEVRAAQELATAEAQLESARGGLVRAQEALGLIVVAEGPLDVAGGDPDIEGAARGRVAPTLAGNLEAAADGRGDVRAIASRVRAADAAPKDRWMFYAPYLAAIGTPFYQNPASLSNPEFGWQAQLVLTLPLYDGGRRAGVFREQDAVARQAKRDLDEKLRQVRAEVRTAFQVMLAADRSLEAAQRAAAAAWRALEMADLAYKAGATSNLEVIDAESRARAADTAAAVAEDAARLARLELLAASGRFP